MNATSPRLDGLVAVVTGASSGIGEATARALAIQGADVVLAARRADRIASLAGELNAGASDHGRAVAITTDVADQAQATAAVRQTIETFGRLDIVVNNAGVMLLGPVVDAPTEAWERMLAANVRGALYITHAALPHLIAAAESAPRRVADVINVSSIAGRQVHVGAAVYNLTKHGIGAFSESLRQELADRHVRVGLVEPGPVDSELGTHLSAAARARAEERLGHIERLTPQDIADTITYMVTRPRRVAMNEIMVRPTNSAF